MDTRPIDDTEVDELLAAADAEAAPAAGPVVEGGFAGRPRTSDHLVASPEPELEYGADREGYYLKMQYAVVARALFCGKTNQQILALLGESDHPFRAWSQGKMGCPMVPQGERARARLKELLATPAFKEYFDEYQKAQFLASDRSANRAIRALQPAAVRQVVRLMTNARSDATKLEAALAVLEMGGTRKKVTERRNFNVEVPAAVAERLVGAKGAIDEAGGWKPRYRDAGGGSTRPRDEAPGPDNGKAAGALPAPSGPDTDRGSR